MRIFDTHIHIDNFATPEQKRILNAIDAAIQGKTNETK